MKRDSAKIKKKQKQQIAEEKNRMRETLESCSSLLSVMRLLCLSMLREENMKIRKYKTLRLTFMEIKIRHQENFIAKWNLCYFDKKHYYMFCL